MPLSELYREAREKLDSTEDKNNNMDSADLSLNPENGVIELVWESGQILLQGQSSRTRKNSNLNSLEAQCSPSHSPRDRDDSVIRDVIGIASSPGFESGRADSDNMVPWLNYHGYTSDLLPELSGVTVNHLPVGNIVASSLRKASVGNQVDRDTRIYSLHNANPNLEDGNTSKLYSFDVSTAGLRRSTNQSHSSASQNSQASFSHLRTKVIGSTENTPGKVLDDSPSQVQLIANSSSSKPRQKLDPTAPSNSSNVINFSHFLRPAALLKSNAPNHDVTGAVGLSSMPCVGSMDKNCSAAYTKARESLLIGTRGSIRNEPSSCCKNAVVPSIDRNSPSDAKPFEQSQAVKQPEIACLRDLAKNDDHPKQHLETGETKKFLDSEKAAASVCSRTSMDGASDDPTLLSKRKRYDHEGSEGHSYDVEEESNDAKRATPAQGSGVKRSRAAEVHNLSERRRRDRINEKMRALQELVPNCNKVDKASMLDEAIEYLKTLQLQVQIMSMGTGLFMPPMMFPGGIPPMNAPHIYPPMGVGTGMGFGIGMPDMSGGSPCYPMAQVPRMHRAHFPGPSISAQTVMHGIPSSNLQVLGLPGHGLPVPMPCGSIAPFPGRPYTTHSSLAGAYAENLGLAAACGSKDASPNMHSPMVQNGGNDPSMVTAPRQANDSPAKTTP